MGRMRGLRFVNMVGRLFLAVIADDGLSNACMHLY